MLGEAMDALASKRPIFHSEADFQHALAWELKSLIRRRISAWRSGLPPTQTSTSTC
jgi:hypothetical protein